MNKEGQGETPVHLLTRRGVMCCLFTGREGPSLTKEKPAPVMGRAGVRDPATGAAGSYRGAGRAAKNPLISVNSLPPLRTLRLWLVGDGAGAGSSSP